MGAGAAGRQSRLLIGSGVLNPDLPASLGCVLRLDSGRRNILMIIWILFDISVLAN